MAKVTVIFVGGNELVDKVIEDVTHGTCSHVAIQILGAVLESQGIPDKGDRYPGVHLHALDKYDNNPYAQFVEVEVPNLAAAVKFLRLPVNLDIGEWTMNCSETVTRILRAGGLSVLPGVDADSITPMDLFRWFVSNE